MEVYLIKKNDNTLAPAYNSDYDKIKKLKAGEEFKCEVRQPRNLKFHRKFFALLNMVLDNQEIYNDLDKLRNDLLVEAGFTETWVDIHSEIQTRGKSISFGSMSEDEFGSVYNRVIDVIVKHFHFNKQEILENVERYF